MRLCHFGECNVCKVEIDTLCVCKKSTVTVNCMDALTKNRCDKVCNIQMACGHLCLHKCHDHLTDTKKCLSKCLKYKVDSCNHLCGRQCHYADNDKCEDIPCKVYTLVFCKCKHIMK